MNVDEPARSPRKRFPTVVSVLGILMGLAALVLIIGGFSLNAFVAKGLEDAVAEADRLDPRWRFEDIQADRQTFAPEENGAYRVIDVLDALPESWHKVIPAKPGEALPEGVALYGLLQTDAPNRVLAKNLADATAAEAVRSAEVIREARGLVRFPDGRYDLPVGVDPLQAVMDNLQNVRQVARLIDFDATARSQAGDVDGALESCRAQLNVARSIGDEPFLISQLVRVAITSMATRAVERALARGEPSDKALELVEEALKKEYAEPVLIYGLRGERAAVRNNLKRVQIGMLGPGRAARLISVPSRAMMRYNEGLSLHLFTGAIEVAKKPLAEQPAGWAAWRAEAAPQGKPLIARHTGALSYLLIPAIDAFIEALQRSTAFTGSIAVAVAAERYRKAKGAWPDSVDAIEKALGATLPRDPYVDAPYHLKPTPEGLTVYSVGPDKVDHGGTLEDRPSGKAGTDFGVRLWDVGRRRQPPSPEPVPPKL